MLKTGETPEIVNLKEGYCRKPNQRTKSKTRDNLVLELTLCSHVFRNSSSAASAESALHHFASIQSPASLRTKNALRHSYDVTKYTFDNATSEQVSFITFGQHQLDGNGFEALSTSKRIVKESEIHWNGLCFCRLGFGRLFWRFLFYYQQRKRS